MQIFNNQFRKLLKLMFFFLLYRYFIRFWNSQYFWWIETLKGYCYKVVWQRIFFPSLHFFPGLCSKLLYLLHILKMTIPAFFVGSFILRLVTYVSSGWNFSKLFIHTFVEVEIMFKEIAYIPLYLMWIDKRRDVFSFFVCFGCAL